jgi:hypothetical protein
MSSEPPDSSSSVPPSFSSSSTPLSSLLSPFVPYSSLHRHTLSSLSSYLNPFSVSVDNIPKALTAVRAHLFHSLASSSSPLLQSFLFPPPPYSPYSDLSTPFSRSFPLRLHPRTPHVYSLDQLHSVRIDSMGDYFTSMRKLQLETPRDPFIGLGIESNIGIQLGLIYQEEEQNMNEFGNPFRKRNGMINNWQLYHHQQNHPGSLIPASASSSISGLVSPQQRADELFLEDSPSRFDPKSPDPSTSTRRKKHFSRPSDRPSFHSFIEKLKIEKEIKKSKENNQPEKNKIEENERENGRINEKNGNGKRKRESELVSDSDFPSSLVETLPKVKLPRPLDPLNENEGLNSQDFDSQWESSINSEED